MLDQNKRLVNFRVTNTFNQPFIVIEPIYPSRDYNEKGFLVIELPDGIELDKANEIAKFLNENVMNVIHTFKNLS